jgi:dihydrofolate reductase
MGKLVYSMLASLDGYVADESGNFDWAEPDASLHAFINDLERSVDTYLYGRRMYQVMSWWETLGGLEEVPPHIRDYANIWRAADKVVYSSTLAEASTVRTRIEREFEASAIERMKAESDRDISIGGPTLASSAIAAGLVDEYQIFVAPVIVGAGLPLFGAHTRHDLQLVDERRLDSGFVYLDYARSGSLSPR